MDGIVALYKQMGWTRGIVIYTDEEYHSYHNTLLHSLMELQLRKWLQQAGVTCSNPKHHLTTDQCASLRNKLLWGSELVE